MKNIDDLKERLKTDVEFKKLFENKRDVNDLIKVARENGYDVSEEDLEKDEVLSEDMLEAVAGGKGRDDEDLDIYERNFYS